MRTCLVLCLYLFGGFIFHKAIESGLTRSTENRCLNYDQAACNYLNSKRGI